MNFFNIQEQRSLLSFVALTLITSFIFILNLNTNIYMGFLAAVWGFFGFYRYIYFHENFNLTLPAVLTLPSRILFGLHEQKERQVKNSINRFLQKDVLIFFILSVIYMVHIILKMPDIFTVLQNITPIFLMGLIIFIGLSYNQNLNILNILKITFLPFIIILSGFIIFFLPSPSLYQLDWLWVIFLPPLLVFLKQLTNPRHYKNALIAIALMLAVVLINYIWPAHAYIHGLNILILSYLSCAWGVLGVKNNPA